MKLLEKFVSIENLKAAYQEVLKLRKKKHGLPEEGVISDLRKRLLSGEYPKPFLQS